MNEALRISIYFFEHIKKFERKNGKFTVPNHYKILVLEDITSLLCGNLTEQIIMLYLEEASKESYQEAYLVSSILEDKKVSFVRGEKKEDKENLLKATMFYYHPYLQVTPGPPKYILNDDYTMELVPSEPFFLEIKPRFTVDDLVDYFIEKTRGDEKQKKGFRSQFLRLLQDYDLDQLLYMIDEGIAVCEDTSSDYPKSPFFLTNYYKEGKEAFENRKNTSIAEGLTHVIPRQHSSNLPVR